VGVTNAYDADLEATLAVLRDDLTKDRPRPLGPNEGSEALRQHKVLAAAVHRAAKLDERGKDSETTAWIRYLTRHYPIGRNSEADAKLLWVSWRTSLLKEGTPGPRVAVAHGQPVIHWTVEQDGTLCLNLEDAWDDFAASVDSFVSSLRTSPRWQGSSRQMASEAPRRKAIRLDPSCARRGHDYGLPGVGLLFAVRVPGDARLASRVRAHGSQQQDSPDSPPKRHFWEVAVRCIGVHSRPNQPRRRR